MTITAWVFLLVSVVGSARGHARFVCPMPMNGNSGNKIGPCGSGDSGQYTVVAPGPMTVRFEETVYHEGAPTAFRLFRKGNPAKSCLLLDHMPHADAWARGLNCGPDPSVIGNFPVGKCRNTTAYVTINIPDIDCSDCVLQLVSVMTDKYSAGQTCVMDDSLSVNCSTYYSCANIKILGKNKDLDVCRRYEDNLAGSWPYAYPLQPGVYGKGEGSTSDFTPGGWLSALRIVWLESGYAPMTMSEGACAPPSERYAAVFDSPEAVGAFSVVVNDGVNIYATGMLSEQIELAWLAGPGAAISLVPQFIRNNSLTAIATVPYNRASLFLGTLGLQLKSGATLTARLAPAVWTVSLRKNSTYYGEVVYTDDSRVSVAIGNLLRSDIRSLSINGPGKSLSSAVLQALDSRLQTKGGILWLTGTLGPLQRNYSITPFLCLGRVYVLAALSSSDNQTISARVPRPRACESAEPPGAQEVFSLMPTGGPAPGGPNITVSGVGTLTYSGSSYSFTLALENVRNGEVATKVQIDGRDVNFGNIASTEGDDIIAVQGTIRWPFNNTAVEVVLFTTAGSYRSVTPISTSLAPILTTTSASQTTTSTMASTTTNAAVRVQYFSHVVVTGRTHICFISAIIFVLTKLVIN